MAIKPITPEEAITDKIASIPEKIFQAVNELIVSNLVNGSAKIYTEDIIDRFQNINDEFFSTTEIKDNGWLDFETLYENSGWDVSYNSNYVSSYTFTKK